MQRVVEVCNELNLTKSDVLLELDFMPDESGTAPALQTPVPNFKVKASRGYFEGERPNEPDWYHKHDDEQVYKSNVEKVLPGLKDRYERQVICYLFNLTCDLI